MSERTNVRLFQVNTPVNVETPDEKYINAGVNAYEGQFQDLVVGGFSNARSRAAVFTKNHYLIKDNDRVIDFGNGVFTIGMWFKFLDARFTAPIYVVLHFEDGSNTYYTLPTQVDDGTGTGTMVDVDYVNDTHYLTVTRDTNGEITMYLDKVAFFNEAIINGLSSDPDEQAANIDMYKPINTANYNLTNNSYFIVDALGYSDNAIGTTMIADDIIITDEDITEVSSNVNPSNYLKGYDLDPLKIPWSGKVKNYLKLY